MKGQWAQARAHDGIKDSAQVGVNAPTLRVGPASHRSLKGLMSWGLGWGQVHQGKLEDAVTDPGRPVLTPAANKEGGKAGTHKVPTLSEAG